MTPTLSPTEPTAETLKNDIQDLHCTVLFTHLILVSETNPPAPVKPVEEEDDSGDDEPSATSSAKRKKKKPKKKKPAGGALKQTDPPTVPLSKFFPSGTYPVGEIREYADKSGHPRPVLTLVIYGGLRQGRRRFWTRVCSTTLMI
jgi:hypothetical protein